METTANQVVNQINPQAPWLSHIASTIRQQTCYTDNALYQSLNQLVDELCLGLDNSEKSPLQTARFQTGRGHPLQFVPQSVLDDINEIIPTAYETHIAHTGQIPTRDNLHDLFNAWVWLTFPKTKAMLNRHQAEQIEQDGISSSRGRVRDAITVLDENGAILITCNPDIADALRNFDWQNCLVKPREQWVNVSLSESAISATNSNTDFDTDFDTHSDTGYDKQAMVMLCGHALMEQLVEPRKPLCSHTFILQVEPDFFLLPMIDKVKKVDDLLVDKVDSWLQQDDVSPRQLSPLPILGVPHFWAENSNVEFYNDNFVFRSGRRKKA